MKALLPLLAASLATLVLSFAWEGPSTSEAVVRHGEPLGDARDRADRAAPPRVHCPRPATLRLRRFEDRSARLECAGRVLVRVSVPG